MPESNPTSTPDAVVAPARPGGSALGIVALLSVIVGTALMFWGFTVGVSAALSGEGGADVYIAIFVIGGVVVALGGILAIVRLIMGRNRIMSAITIVLALLPVAAIVALRVASGA